MEVPSPGLDEGLAVELVDLLERLQAIRHEARADDVHARALRRAQLRHLPDRLRAQPLGSAKHRLEGGRQGPHRQTQARLEGPDRVTALGAVGVPGLVHGDRDRMEGHNDAVPRQEVRATHALPMALEGGRERLDVRGGGGEGAMQAQLESVAVAADPLGDRVVDRRHRRGRVLRVGRQDRHATHPFGMQAVQNRTDRGLPVAHRDLDAHARQALAEESGLLAGVVHERRALVQPDAAVLVGHLARAHAQDDALQDGLPQEWAHLDDAAIGEELAQECTHRARLGSGRRPQVNEDEGGLHLALLRMVRRRHGGCCVLGIRHATSLMFALPRVADVVSPPGACALRAVPKPYGDLQSPIRPTSLSPTYKGAPPVTGGTPRRYSSEPAWLTSSRRRCAAQAWPFCERMNHACCSKRRM